MLYVHLCFYLIYMLIDTIILKCRAIFFAEI